ncbi:hypothetical protein [Lysinibacillus capsici]|jgi:hypothetical protein|uniref:hypothetical protein n=1 Tax=Lysinibacillus capsici TaxID=2115968 RepID=UPI003D73BE1F
METFNYLKKKKITGEEILNGYCLISTYYSYFSKTIVDLPLFPTKEDKFDMSFSIPRQRIAGEVLRIIDREFKVKNNTKYLSKVFKGDKLYLVANNIYSLYEFCEYNYAFLEREKKKVAEHKRDYMNLLPKEYNNEMLINWGMMGEGLLEILYILFGEDFNKYIFRYCYSEEVYIKHMSFINMIKTKPLWPEFQINYE